MYFGMDHPDSVSINKSLTETNLRLFLSLYTDLRAQDLLPERALAEGAAARNMDPAAATFHQADCVPRRPVEATGGPGVPLKPLYLHGRVAIGVTGLL